MPVLADLTTLGLGGPARGDSREVTGPDDLRDLGSSPVLIVGGGSNLVVADEGVDATVLLVRNRGVHVEGSQVTIAAGEPWDDVVVQTMAAGRAGLAALSGIPGLAGATPIQNVGAYGTEIAEFLVSVTVFHRPSGRVRVLPAAELGLGYRTSVLRGRSDQVVLDVVLELPDRPVGVRYAELARRLGVEPGTAVPEPDVRPAVLELRRSKGMVLDPGDPDSRSAGSFFTNPIVPAATLQSVRDRLADDVVLPSWPGPHANLHKLSAAWLIERAGFAKGYPGPGSPVRISGKHTLALVNAHGTTADLVRLAREIRDGVQARFGVRLEPEPVFVGLTLDGDPG